MNKVKAFATVIYIYIYTHTHTAGLFYTQPNQYSLPTVTPPPAQPNKPTTCNQPVTNPLRHAKKQIRERERRDARSAASGEREPFRASFSAALA